VVLLNKEIKLLANQIEDQVCWQKKDATLNFLNIYITQFLDLNSELQKEIGIMTQDGHTIDGKELINKLKNEKFRTKLFHLMSYFENLSIEIFEDYCDNHIAKLLMKNIMISTYDTFLPYIRLRRNETGVDVCNNFERLVNDWSNRKKDKNDCLTQKRKLPFNKKRYSK